jgi:hypothetical protein
MIEPFHGILDVETVQRAVLVQGAYGELDRLRSLIEEALLELASNEQARQTFFRGRDEEKARGGVEGLSRRGQWDYHRLFLSAEERDRRNPFRADATAPGVDFSGVEHPSLETLKIVAERARQREEDVLLALLQPPLMTQQRTLQQLQLEELRGRRAIGELYSDLVMLCRRKMDRIAY